MFKEIEDYWGAEAATRSGMFGALGYCGYMVFVGILMVLDRAGIPFSLLTSTAQTLMLAILGAQFAVSALAAYRFSMGKGLIPGSITLVILVLNLFVSVINGMIPGIIWWILFIAIIIGLVNGIHGAWAMRTMQHPGDVTETFE